MVKVIGYFKSLVAEMKLISWPKKPEVWGSTKIVIGMSLILVLFVFLSDQVLNWLMGMFL
ncbi:MAG: preprotein translocase subunit SecE [Candidatus Delongbacteria bacterium]|jgi:preprotein translocase SecE subunit|nr:preprotein translocase subunit SecE [Candidatus Delongbacteria bacterium]